MNEKDIDIATNNLIKIIQTMYDKYKQNKKICITHGHVSITVQKIKIKREPFNNKLITYFNKWYKALALLINKETKHWK